MSQQKKDPPHETPNPDGPHAAAGSSDGERAASKVREGAVSHSTSSGTDEIHLKLLAADLEPDPFLESAPLGDSPQRVVEAEHQVCPPAGAVFQGPPTEDRPQVDSATESFGPGLEPGLDPLAGLALESPDPERASGHDFTLGSLPPAVPGHAADQGQDLDQDQEAGERIPWITLLLLTYATILTLFLTWILATGRLRPAHSAEPASSLPGRPDPAGGSGSAAPLSTATAPAPPVPESNIIEVGGAIRLGDLEVQALAVDADQVSLIRSVAADESRKERDQSLILRIRCTNHGESAFTPLDRARARDQGSVADRAEITTSAGVRIRSFPLAYESEWEIASQVFPELKPGESAETLLASETGKVDQVGDGAVWRVRLRTGVFKSDVLGVRFRGDQVVRKPVVPVEDVAEDALPFP